MKRYKVQTLISVVGLSVGLFCYSICDYYSHILMDTNTGMTHRDRLAVVTLNFLREGDTEKSAVTVSSSDLTNVLRESDFTTVETFTSVVNNLTRYYTLEEEEETKQIWELNAIEVDTFYNQVFTPRLYSGNWNTVTNEINALILSRSVATRLFGEGVNPVGKKMILAKRLGSSPPSTPAEGGIAYTVQGVMEDLPPNTSFSSFKPVDMLVFNDTDGWIHSERRSTQSSVFTYVLIREGYSFADLQNELEEKQIIFNSFDRVQLVSAQYPKELAVRASYEQRRNVRVIGALLMGVGLLNFFYFLITSYWSRMREYAVRRVVGCSVLQLFYQLGVQTILGLLLILLFVFLYAEVVGPSLYLPIRYELQLSSTVLYPYLLENWTVVVFLSLFICFLIAKIWDYFVKKKGLSFTIRQRKGIHLRNIILGIQFFICWIFLACTLGLFFQSNKMVEVLYGTLSPQEKESVFHVGLDYMGLSTEKKVAFVEKIRAFSGIKTVSLTSSDILIPYRNDIRRYDEKDPKGQEINIKPFSVDSSFFSLMNLEFISGKAMKENEIVVNESFMKAEAVELGTLYDCDGPRSISGVVPDFLTTVSPWNQDLHLYIFRLLTIPDSLKHLHHPDHLYIKAQPGQQASVRTFLEKEFREIVPGNRELKLTTLAQDIRDNWYLENKLKNTILFLSVISILITLLGVYSAITFDTIYRQKEVALRKINGARTKDIVLIFARLYLILLFVSAGVAFPMLYLFFSDWKSRNYTVTFDYGFSFGLIVFGILFLMTSLTIFFKISRIARVNPATILKNE